MTTTQLESLAQQVVDEYIKDIKENGPADISVYTDGVCRAPDVYVDEHDLQAIDRLAIIILRKRLK